MQSMQLLNVHRIDEKTNSNNDFTIGGFKSPQRVQWINGRGKSLKLSTVLDLMSTDDPPRILEIAVSWNEIYQRTTILNIIKNIHHQYCTFDPQHHAPVHIDISSDDNDNDCDDDDKKIEIENLNLFKTQPMSLMPAPLPPDLQPSISAPSPSYKQCLQIYDHIPIINDHIPKTSSSAKPKPDKKRPKNDVDGKRNIGNIPKKIDLQKQKTLTRIGQCLALEELFAILCWQSCSNLAIKIQFADIVTIQNSTQLILKYQSHFKLDLSSIWYHGIFLHEFPMARSLKHVFSTLQSNKLSFHDFTHNICKVPALTYSLSWPTNNMNAVKSPPSLKLCLSSILSEISIGNEHDIIIHFPIQYIYDSYYIINDLITNKSYFPYVAFNFFNQHNNLHNFDFAIYYKLNYDQNNGKNGYHKNGQLRTQKTQHSQSSSWLNPFGRKQKSIKSKSQLPYDTNIAENSKLKQEQIVCKTDLNWLSSHIHQLFSFTSVSCVRFKNSPNDEFRKILGQHYVSEWSGRLSWNPNRSHHRSHSHSHSLFAHKKKRPALNKRISVAIAMEEKHEQPGIDWDLWQLARLDSKSRHFQSCIYNNNIGLAQRNGGWLISTRELRAPYRIKGRFFTADKHGILSIYIRCSSIEYPANNELPLFSIGIHIGNEKLKIVTYRLQNKQMTQQCGIGACIDNGYDFQIIDRGVMYPIVCQVERTGKDGKGDNFPQGKNLQIPYPRDSSQWMYHVMFVNSSNEWIIIDRLVVDEKHS